MYELNPRNDDKQAAPDEVSEYGIEQLMGSEEELEHAREQSQYHFSQEQLEHKRDRFEQVGEESPVPQQK